MPARKTPSAVWLNRLRENLSPLFGVTVIFVLAVFYGSPAQTHRVNGRDDVRIGYFPNVTHTPALVGMARGDFQQALGSRANAVPLVFNDGPTAMEALLAGEVDLCYCGPGPAINTYLKTKGRALVVMAGACSGGAALVARSDAAIVSLRDLDGKRVAVPQLGGTQDISLRHFTGDLGLTTTDKGGSLQIIPCKNGDVPALFAKKEIDAAWVPEPFVTRLIHETGARLIADERDLWPRRTFMTTVLVARRAFLEQHGNQAQAIVRANADIITWLRAHPDEGQAVANKELKRLSSKALKPDILREAWTRCDWVSEPDADSMQQMIASATRAGYLPPNTLQARAMLHAQVAQR